MSKSSSGFPNDGCKRGGVETNTNLNEIEPLVVKPRAAWQLLGCSNTYGYELLAANELESFKDGKSRKITMSSIKARIARLLAAESASSTGTSEAALRKTPAEGVVPRVRGVAGGGRPRSSAGVSSDYSGPAERT